MTESTTGTTKYNTNLRSEETREIVRELATQKETLTAIAQKVGVDRRRLGEYMGKRTYKDDWVLDKPYVNPYDVAPESQLPVTSLIPPAHLTGVPCQVALREIERGKDNRRILNISDAHMPYHHPDMIEFLTYLKGKYQPTRVICGGDELDKHSLSFHSSSPELSSAGDELKRSLPVVKELYDLFPEMDLLSSNHGSLVYRKAKEHGIPIHYLKSYKDVLEVGDGWSWYFDLNILLPNGQRCYYTHGKVNNVMKVSTEQGCNAVQFHYHDQFKVEYRGNSSGLFWGLQSGCLIDDRSLAFSYNNCNLKRPIIGTSLIIDSKPILEPMILGLDGRWVDRDAD